MPNAEQAAAAKSESEKSSILAEISKLPGDEPKAAKKADEASKEPATEPQGEKPDGEEEAKPDGEPKEPEDKAARSKWLEQKHREEKRLAQERQRLQAEWGSRVDKVERFERDFEPALKDDPIGTLIRAGYFDPGDAASVERAGRKLAAYKRRFDPKAAPAAEADLRGVEVEDRVAAAERRAEAAEARVQRFEAEQRAQQVLSRAVALADDKTPALKALIANDPDEAQTILDYVGGQLMRASGGELPSPAALVEAAEKFERQNLKKRGIDPETYFAPKAQPKPATPSADEKKTAKSLPAALGTPTTPREKPMTPAEEKQWILGQIRAGAGE